MTGSGLGVLTWAAIVAVLAAAAVLSFDAVRDLAVLCGVQEELAPLLPISIDGGVAVGTRVWLSGRAVIAERFARRMTMALLGTTVAANALHSALVAVDARPAWWVAVAVGAVPAFVVGSVCHLVALLIRRPAEQDAVVLSPTPAPGLPPVQVGQVFGADHLGNGRAAPGGSGPDDRARQVAPALVGQATDLGIAEDGPAPDRAAELIAEGAGRRRLARELGITEHAARELIDGHRTGQNGTAEAESAPAQAPADARTAPAVGDGVLPAGAGWVR